MSTKRSTISVSSETVEKLKEVQAYITKQNGFEPSITQVIDYLISVEVKVRSITEEK